MKSFGAIAAMSVLLLGLAGCSAGSSAAGEGQSGSASPSGSRTASSTASASRTAGCGKTFLEAGQSKTVEIESDGRKRSYLVSAPKGYAADTTSPVVLAFHGRSRTSAYMSELTGFSDKPTIAVYPQGLEGSKGTAWQGAGYASDADDVQFAQDVLNDVESRLCTDTGRVFAAGMSNGGGFASLLACRMSDRIAAFASVSGAYYEGTCQGCANAGPAPVVEFHGTGDPTMHYDGGDGKGGKYISVDEYVRQWVARNHCSTQPEVDRPTNGVEHETFDKGCLENAEVQHYRIEGGGHTWPGAPEGMGTGRDTPDLHATDLIWDSFQKHPLSQRS